MKKKVMMVALIFGSIMLSLIPNARADNSNYIGIKQGATYTFTYTINSTIRGNQGSFDLPVTIVSITEISSTASNVTYQTTYEIEPDGIPINQVNTTSVIINETMDLFKYVNASNNAFGLFFISKNNTTKKILISTGDNFTIGSGCSKCGITWDQNGVLYNANFTAKISGKDYFISIVQKGTSSVPGYSIQVISCALLGTVVFIVMRLVKKERKKIVNT